MRSKDLEPDSDLINIKNKKSKREWSRPGTWFAYPLPAGGYGIALVVRRAESKKRFREIFVHVFGARFESVEEIPPELNYRPEDKIASGFTFDQGIMDGRWPIIGRIAPFNRYDWPVPLMKSGPFGGGPDWKRRFMVYRMGEDLQPAATLGERILEEPSKYVTWSTSGYIAFEYFAERVINGGSPDPDP